MVTTGVTDVNVNLELTNIDTVLPPKAATTLRSMLERRFPGILMRCQWRLRPSSGRNLVLEIKSSSQPAAHPRSMIVKCPAYPGRSVQRNNHEVSCMQYLRALSLGDLRRIAPEVYVHDPDQGIFAMEDLVLSRDARCLEDILQLQNPQKATASLRALAQAVGKLHFHTFTRRSISSNGRPREFRSWLMPDMDKTAKILRRKARKIGSSFGAADLKELQDIDQLLYHDGISAFSHGDVSPKNVFISVEGIHLCDFEASGLLHPFLEGMHLGWPFPLSLEAGNIPASVIEEMKAAYRREFDFESAMGREMKDQAEAATLIVMLLYHWVYTFPEVGLPIAYAGSRAKVADLMELLHQSTCGFYFPNLTRLLLQLDKALFANQSLCPDHSILYECFRNEPFDTAELTHTIQTKDCISCSALQISGIFRVNSSCHLVIKRCHSSKIGVYVLEYPHIRCTASLKNRATFRGIEMPLELSYITPSKMAVCDLRTGKTIQIQRQRLSIAVLRHFRQWEEISRYHRSAFLHNQHEQTRNDLSSEVRD